MESSVLKRKVQRKRMKTNSIILVGNFPTLPAAIVPCGFLFFSLPLQPRGRILGPVLCVHRGKSPVCESDVSPLSWQGGKVVPGGHTLPGASFLFIPASISR